MTRWMTVHASRLQCVRIPARPGVYILIADGEPLYVGRSDRLDRRLATYQIRYGYGAGNSHCIFGSFDSLIVKVRPEVRFGDSFMHEARFIRRLRPKLNQRGIACKQHRLTASELRKAVGAEYA